MVKKRFESGIITSDQYGNDDVDHNEVIRAKYLVKRLQEPVTGFEKHLLKCWYENAIPACRKEEQLIKAMLQSIAYDEALDASAWANDEEVYPGKHDGGLTGEDYEREEEQITCELVAELEERTRIRRGLKPKTNQMNVVLTRQQSAVEECIARAREDAYRSELISSYQNWVDSSDDEPFIP